MTLILFLNKKILIGEIKHQNHNFGDSLKADENSRNMGVIEFIKFPPILILFFFYVAANDHATS